MYGYRYTFPERGIDKGYGKQLLRSSFGCQLFSVP